MKPVNLMFCILLVVLLVYPGSARLETAFRFEPPVVVFDHNDKLVNIVMSNLNNVGSIPNGPVIIINGTIFPPGNQTPEKFNVSLKTKQVFVPIKAQNPGEGRLEIIYQYGTYSDSEKFSKNYSFEIAPDEVVKPLEKSPGFEVFLAIIAIFAIAIRRTKK